MQEKNIRKSSRNTFLVMLCTLASRLLGFVRLGVINALFGDAGMADVLNGVFNIPNNLRKLFAEGALSAAYIPILSKAVLNDPEGESPRKLVRNIFTALLVVLIPLCLLFIIFAGPLMSLLVPFPDAEKLALAVPLFRYLCLYILFISLSALLMGVLNTHNIFIPSALAPLLFSICVISSLVLLHAQLGIFAMAVGVLAGGLAQFFFQLPFFSRLSYDLKPNFQFNNPPFRQMLKQYLPIVTASVVASVNQLIANGFASGLEDGSVTALTNAIVLWQFPFGIFSASITTVLFPRMSRQAAVMDKSGLRESLSHGIRFNLLLLVPAGIALMLFGREIIALAYERGAFSTAGSILAGRVLFYYAMGLFPVGAYMYIQRFFYSVKDYYTPLRISIFVVFLDIVLSLWLKETSLQVAGLALANSLSFSIGLVIILALARKRSGGIHGKMIMVTAGKVALAMALMVALLLFYKRLTGDFWTTGSSLRNALLMSGAVIIGLGSTFLVYLVTDVKILKDILIRRSKR